MKKIKRIFKGKDKSVEETSVLDNNNNNQAVSSSEQVAKTDKEVILDNSIRNFLLIGRSGNGKSTLANVITKTNNFKESEKGVSETKIVQNEEFEENGIKGLIIDTPGIGDNKLKENEVLDIIAEAVYLVKDGVSQVFFVSRNRFDQSEMATYDLLRTIIFDKDIAKHTTIVRTRFSEFRDEDKCKEDIKLMIKKNNKLAEIVKSCQEKIIHVDNPSIEVGDDDEKRVNERKRARSRKMLSDHLKKTCQETSYKPEKLQSLSSDIVDYMERKKELEEELKKLSFKETKPVDTQTPEIRNNESRSENVPSQSNEVEPIKKEKQEVETSGDNIGIIDKKEYEKMIAELQDKKERLKKQIQDKEKAIRQKVLEHIFNNYSEISKESGGETFLSSVKGDHNWPEISPGFVDEKLIVEWLSKGFNYQQIKDWATVLGDDFKPKIDADFCAWLRDKKQLTVEIIKRASYPQNIERLRQEYAIYLGKEIEVLDKHNEQFEKKDWTDIHEDFDEYYQQKWEEQGLTYQDAQEWIKAGFEPEDYEGGVKQWKNLNFILQQVKSWIDVGLNKKDSEFAAYLRDKGHQPNLDLNLEQLGTEFTREWLDKNYPQDQRKEITELDIISKSLQGPLDLSDFVNLEELRCDNNKLANLLGLNNCDNLWRIHCPNNQLTQIKLPQGEKLKTLWLTDNNLNQDLSFLSHLGNLKDLYLDNNLFYGSLEYLQNMNKLEWLFISDTNLDSGWEYLPDSLKNFNCSASKRPEAKCKVIYKLFANDQGEVETEGKWQLITNFPQKLQTCKQKLQGQSQPQAQIQQANSPFNPNK